MARLWPQVFLIRKSRFWEGEQRTKTCMYENALVKPIPSYANLNDKKRKCKITSSFKSITSKSLHPLIGALNFGLSFWADPQMSPPSWGSPDMPACPICLLFIPYSLLFLLLILSVLLPCHPHSPILSLEAPQEQAGGFPSLHALWTQHNALLTLMFSKYWADLEKTAEEKARSFGWLWRRVYTAVKNYFVY